MTIPSHTAAVLLAAAILVQCGDDPVSASQATGAKASSGTPQKTSPAAIPAPLKFNREAKLEFADEAGDIAFNFVSRGTIDMLVCPSGGTGVNAEDDARFHQALVSCADDEAAGTRYGIFMLGDLDGLGFWNGTKWWRIDHDFEPNAWVHLTVVFQRGWTTFAVDGEAIGVVRAPIGRPIDPDDPDGRKFRFCKTYIGGTSSGHDGFAGQIASVRTWRTALSMYHVGQLPGILGIPEDPVLAQVLAASSAFTEKSQAMQRSSIAMRAALAEQARAAKIEQAFTKQIPWLFDLEQAKQAAAKSKRRILAWCTRGDAYDPASLAIESDLLGDKLWGDVKDRFVPLLLVGTTTDRQPGGVRAGSCALLDAEGRVQRTFIPWSSEFVQAMEQDVAAAGAAGQASRTRARQLLLRPAATLTPAQLSELVSLADGGDLSDPEDADVLLRIRDAQQVAKILDLQARFQRGEDLGPADGAALPFEEAQFIYDAQALELFAALKLPLEPHRRLADFAVLLWRGVVESARLDLAQDAADFLVPMRALDPVVDAVMTAQVIDTGLEDEDEKKGGEGK